MMCIYYYMSVDLDQTLLFIILMMNIINSFMSLYLLLKLCITLTFKSVP